MKVQKIIAATAVATVLSIATISAAHAADAPATEKCYGVAKAGKNDCKGASNSCSGLAKADGGFVSLPAGTCGKIVGGSTTEPAAKK